MKISFIGHVGTSLDAQLLEELRKEGCLGHDFETSLYNIARPCLISREDELFKYKHNKMTYH